MRPKRMMRCLTKRVLAGRMQASDSSPQPAHCFRPNTLHEVTCHGRSHPQNSSDTDVCDTSDRHPVHCLCDVYDGPRRYDDAAGVTMSDLKCVTFVNASVGYAAGSAGTVVKTTDGGTTWAVVRSGDSLDLTGVTFWNATRESRSHPTEPSSVRLTVVVPGRFEVLI